MVSVMFFKCCVTQSDVCFFCLRGDDLCLIDDIPNIAISFKGARILKNVTELSKYVWSLKERKINYQIKWRKVKQARSYSNVNKKKMLSLPMGEIFYNL